MEIAKFLIERGADVTLKAEDGCTPLEIATHQGKNGSAHTSLVSPRRKREIEEGCREIAAMLKTQTAG